MRGCCRPRRSAIARMLAPSNPRSANSAMAASRIETRVSSERCCSALLRGRSRRTVFFAIGPSINMVPNRTPSKLLIGFQEPNRGCRVIDCLELSMLTAKFLDLCPRRNPFVCKPEVIFDHVDAVDQTGANDERWLDPEYRITS